MTNLLWSRFFFEAAALQLLIGGALHLVSAVVDYFRPTILVPINDEVRLTMMQSTGLPILKLGRHSPNIWRSWIGFNISFGLNLGTFAAIFLLIAAHDYRLIIRTPGLMLITVAVPAILVVISARCWFYMATILFVTSTVCFGLAALLA